jgi:hypothetical protein
VSENGKRVVKPSGYVIDDLSLIAGLVGTGSEYQRREMSRLLRDARFGGPPVHIPALCLTEAAVVRPMVAGHVAELVASMPPGALEVCGLIRTDQLDSLRASDPRLDWPATQAAEHARAKDLILVSTDPDKYPDVVDDRQEL